MLPMRPTTSTFGHWIFLFPNHFATIQISFIAERNHESIRKSEKVAITQPSNLVVKICFALRAWLRISGVVFREPVFVGSQTAVLMIIQTPINWRIVGISEINPDDSLLF